MKKNILIVAALMVAVALTSCIGNASNHKGTHTHDDGSTHEAHTEAPSTSPAPKQENFNVDNSTQEQVKAAQKEHKHEEHKGHSHGNDCDHKH